MTAETKPRCPLDRCEFEPMPRDLRPLPNGWVLDLGQWWKCKHCGHTQPWPPGAQF